MSNMVYINADGNLVAGGVVVDLHEFQDKLDTKVGMHITNTTPNDYAIGDIWLKPDTGVFYIARIGGGNMFWMEIPFGNTGGGATSSGGADADDLQLVVSALESQIRGLNVINKGGVLIGQDDNALTVDNTNKLGGVASSAFQTTDELNVRVDAGYLKDLAGNKLASGDSDKLGSRLPGEYLDVTKGNMPYVEDFTVPGDPDKYYLVQFTTPNYAQDNNTGGANFRLTRNYTWHGGYQTNQSVWESSVDNYGGSSTHQGGLVMEMINYGSGWSDMHETTVINYRRTYNNVISKVTKYLSGDRTLGLWLRGGFRFRVQTTYPSSHSFYDHVTRPNIFVHNGSVIHGPADTIPAGVVDPIFATNAGPMVKWNGVWDKPTDLLHKNASNVVVDQSGALVEAGELTPSLKNNMSRRVCTSSDQGATANQWYKVGSIDLTANTSNTTTLTIQGGDDHPGTVTFTVGLRLGSGYDISGHECFVNVISHDQTAAVGFLEGDIVMQRQGASETVDLWIHNPYNYRQFTLYEMSTGGEFRWTYIPNPVAVNALPDAITPEQRASSTHLFNVKNVDGYLVDHLGNNLKVNAPSTRTSLLLGNSDWSEHVTAGTGEYSPTHKGYLMSSASVVFLDTSLAIPIDPEKTYRVKVRVKKLSGTGMFYCGVNSLDNDLNTVSTDLATSYNYGTTAGTTIPVGETRTFNGYYRGYNRVTDNNHNKFDPEAAYFIPIFICNYQGSGESVIESLEVSIVEEDIEVSSRKLGSSYLQSALMIRELNRDNNQTGVSSEAPRISFHWRGRVASQIGMGIDGVIRTYNNPGSDYESFAAKNITAHGTLTELSDSRLKENVTTLVDALAKVLELRGVSYNKITDPNLPELGLIAQEVERVAPEVITTDNDGMKSVSYGRLTSLLVEAMKEQSATIETMETRITNLEHTVQQLLEK